MKEGDLVIDIYRSPHNKGNEGVVVCAKRFFKKKISVNGVEYRTKEKISAGYNIVVKFSNGDREIYMTDGLTYITFTGCYVPRIALYLRNDPILSKLGIR